MQQLHPGVTAPDEDRIALFRMLGPVFFYFFVAGIATVMLGPLLPALIQHWQIQDSQAGTLFTADFLGQLCGAWIAARNLRGSLLYGSALSALGCATLSSLSFGNAHIALFCIGVGLGTGLTAGNIIAGTTLPSARARLLAILNVAWGLGAIACPLLLRIAGAGDIRRFFFVLAILFVIASLFSTAIKISSSSSDSAETSQSTSSSQLKQRMPLPLLPLMTFAAAMFLYVGVENSLGGWLPTYAVRTHPSLQASFIAIYFWVAELVGRLLVAALMFLLGEPALYRLCLVLLIIIETLLCVLVHISAGGILTLTILGGFTLAPVFPLLVSFMLARTGNHKRLGPLFASASVGGAVLPWITGVCSTQFHNLRAGLVVPAAGAVLLLILSGVITAKPITSRG
ncbi:MFS transporter [Tunturiibacter lichenicola]|uniref:MFS transporter n=1 Tax=Tunturiibacter lichenicola TaxID=2051959 RepID=UPI003D9B5A1E